jgi:hypothetical protein
MNALNLNNVEVTRIELEILQVLRRHPKVPINSKFLAPRVPDQEMVVAVPNGDDGMSASGLTIGVNVAVKYTFLVDILVQIGGIELQGPKHDRVASRQGPPELLNRSQPRGFLPVDEVNRRSIGDTVIFEIDSEILLPLVNAAHEASWRFGSPVMLFSRVVRRVDVARVIVRPLTILTHALVKQTLDAVTDLTAVVVDAVIAPLVEVCVQARGVERRAFAFFLIKKLVADVPERGSDSVGGTAVLLVLIVKWWQLSGFEEVYIERDSMAIWGDDFI